MARAKITLRGSMTHTVKGRTFRKGFPQIITNLADIKYYESQPGFHVEMLSAPKKASTNPAAPKKTKDVPKPQVEEKPAAETHSRDKLKSMKKMELFAIAKHWGVETEGNEKKLDIIEAILEAQEAEEGA